MSDVVRIKCVNDDCGTFPMDRALRDKLKRTGDTFTCPAGHRQHFTDSPEQQLRERVKELEKKVERYRDLAHDRSKDASDNRRKAKRLRSRLLDNVEGVVEVDEDSWMWSCNCGSRGQKEFDTEGDALDAYERHQNTDAHDPAATDGGDQDQEAVA